MEEFNKLSLITNFSAGGVSGVCLVLVGHPFDTIKVRLQTMPITGPPLYTGTWNCFVKTVQLEGFKALFKGMAAPIAGITPVYAISFLGFGIAKKFQQTHPEEQLTLVQFFIAGTFSSIAPTIIVAPCERIKCLLQIQQGSSNSPKYNGPIDCVRQLYKEGGMRSLYRGTTATLFKEVPSGGVYFATYEWLQIALAPKDNEKSSRLSPLRTILAGGLAGIANWIIALPPDVLKSRLQTAPEGTYPNGMRDAFTTLVRDEGVTALYKGAVPVFLRAFPANAACFLGFESAQQFFNWLLSL